ncbi:hemerythrin [Clostridia bacterium]|nr:hemerythrin [Clostridia bacterium]
MPQEDTSWSQGVKWMPKLETGNATIDSQHKRLFELTSDLVEACATDQSASILEATINFLVDYTIQHFADEEELQVRYNYPQYKTHKKAHDDFKIKVGEMVAKYTEEGSSENLAKNVNSIVVRWLVSHISYEDIKMAKFINDKKALEADARNSSL